MVIFQDDDAIYMEFLQNPSHRNGFVLNTTRVRSRYAVLHRAHCHTIQGVPTAGQRWTTGDYRKVWAATAQEIIGWATEEISADASPCGICRPIDPSEGKQAGLASASSAIMPTTEGSKEVVVELAAEGGGETIFRRQTENGWVYWSDGNSMDIDEDDVDYVRSWHSPETGNFSDLLPSIWPYLSALQIHPEWRDWFREAYYSFLKGLDEKELKEYERFGSRKERWTDLIG